MTKVNKRLVADLIRQGFDVQQSGKGRYFVYLPSTDLALVLPDAADKRATASAIALLKRFGFQERPPP